MMMSMMSVGSEPSYYRSRVFVLGLFYGHDNQHTKDTLTVTQERNPLAAGAGIIHCLLCNRGSKAEVCCIFSQG
jgi:hypothetical protein